MHVPVKRVHNLTSRKVIPHRKQEGRLLFRRDELDPLAGRILRRPARGWTCAQRGPMMGSSLVNAPAALERPGAWHQEVSPDA
ncbi:MAG: hypothetical protein H0W31_02585 [Actinobacteria bacterium]|nr:hypothetical protein [Actinomycetota bacterium]